MRCLLLILFTLSAAVAQAQSRFIRTPKGLIGYTDSTRTGGVQAVRLEAAGPATIRVTAAPSRDLPPIQSLALTDTTTPPTRFTVSASGEHVSLQLPALTARLHLPTGTLVFLNASGRELLREAGPRARSFTPTWHNGQPYQALTQTFRAQEGDDWYGLGQHQEGIMSWKGKDVLLFQNNTEVAVPFLLSPRGWGLLWDNYSLTRAGTLRPQLPLNALRLTAKDGTPGFLTASYYNDTALSAPTLTRAESGMDMPFLGDSRRDLPPAFTPATGKVVWEGTIASEGSGLHHLRFTFGGTLKVTTGGRTILHRWRKAWNPAPALVPLELAGGKAVPVRIEWTPEGGESYLSFRWLPPLTREEENTFSFASEAGGAIDYYFMAGSGMDEVIGQYRHLTGRAPVPPRWALGFWQSRERYKTAEEMLQTAAEFRRRRIPIDNIVLDWSYWKEQEWGSQEWDSTRFPDPDGLIRRLHAQDFHFMISVWPKFYEGIPAYQRFRDSGWLYPRNVADRQRDWIGPGYVSTFYDAFHPAARRGFWNLIHDKIYKRGIDAWWMDASEPDILSNVSPGKRKEQMTPTYLGPAAEWLNAYPLQNAKGIWEGQRSADPDRRVFLLTRSGFAGSQRYGAAIWSGDVGSTWDDLRIQIPAGLHFSMSGLPWWTMDIGGFVVERRFEQPDSTATEEWRELQTRWFQYGAFVPLFRAHGQYPFREVFNIAPEGHPAYNSMLWYNRLRYRLMPYIYSLAGGAYHHHGTPMRALVMDFPRDTAVRNLADQYLFGPSIMVSPVTHYRWRSREVYLPAGTGWYDLYSGKYSAGGRRVTADAPYERMPLHVRAGAIIPFGPQLQHTGERKADTIDLFVYTGANGSFTLYEDGDTTNAYERGAHLQIPIQWNEGTRTLTVGKQEGTYPGALTARSFRIYFITPQRARPLESTAGAAHTIRYTGGPQRVRL